MAVPEGLFLRLSLIRTLLLSACVALTQCVASDRDCRELLEGLSWQVAAVIGM